MSFLSNKRYLLFSHQGRDTKPSPNAGGMQCLIKEARNPKFTMNLQFQAASKKLSEWICHYHHSIQGAQETRNQEWLSALYLKKTMAWSQANILITAKVHADAEHTALLWSCFNEGSHHIYSAKKQFQSNQKNDKSVAMTLIISRLAMVASPIKTQSSSTLPMLRYLSHLPWVEAYH